MFVRHVRPAMTTALLILVFGSRYGSAAIILHSSLSSDPAADTNGMPSFGNQVNGSDYALTGAVLDIPSDSVLKGMRMVLSSDNPDFSVGNFQASLQLNTTVTNFGLNPLTGDYGGIAILPAPTAIALTGSVSDMQLTNYLLTWSGLNLSLAPGRYWVSTPMSMGSGVIFVSESRTSLASGSDLATDSIGRPDYWALNVVTGNSGTVALDFSIASVPEPSTWLMLLAGTATGGLFAWRRRGFSLASW